MVRRVGGVGRSAPAASGRSGLVRCAATFRKVHPPFHLLDAYGGDELPSTVRSISNFLGGVVSRSRQQRGERRFSLGGEAAEADPLLHESFYETSQYESLSSRDDPKCFLVGRTGSGKSAMLRQIEEEHAGRVIRISPEDLSLPYIAGLGGIKHLVENEVHLAPFFSALWKHIFLVEIIRHRYSVTSPVAKQNFLSALRDAIAQDRSKLAALEYLNDFGDRFWCETDERVREITERFEQQVKAEAGVGISSLGLQAGVEANGLRSIEHRSELTERYQKIVNDTQMPRLNKMITVLNEDILDSPQHFTWIVIDDLDRDWVDDAIANDLIMCLFGAVVEMKRVRNLKILVALRSNIFTTLDFASRKGGQEEKFRALTTHIRWAPADIRGMLDERVRAAGDRIGAHDLTAVSDILPSVNTRRGDALEFILRRTMMRPRDALAFLNHCHELTVGSPQISWDSINEAEPNYSHNRLLALRDEWKRSFPGLEAVFGVFAGAPTVISPEDFRKLLDDVALLLASHSFSGRDWLMEATKEVWGAGGQGLQPFRPLVELLFDIGFIGFRLASPKAIFSQDQPEFLNQHHAFSAVAGFVVHPAFWATLSISRRDGL